MPLEDALSMSSSSPPITHERVNVGANDLATPVQVAQLIARLPYTGALTVATFCSGDVDKIVDGALAFLVAEQAHAQS